MRALLIVGLSCAASIASAAPKPKVAILGLEVVAKATPDKETVRVADDLTMALRTRPRAGTGPWSWAPGSERDLVDEKLINNCENEAPACMATIGSQLGADVVLYGKLEKKGSDYQVTIRALDVATKKVMIGWTDLVTAAESTGIKLQDVARRGYGRISGSQPAPASPAPATPSTPATAPAAAKGTCDPAGPMAKGDDLMNMGTYAAALVQYEKALACGPSVPLTARAFVVACKSNNTAKAKLYYGKLPADKRQTYAQVCIKQSIDLPTSAP